MSYSLNSAGSNNLRLNYLYPCGEKEDYGRKLYIFPSGSSQRSSSPGLFRYGRSRPGRTNDVLTNGKTQSPQLQPNSITSTTSEETPAPPSEDSVESEALQRVVRLQGLLKAERENCREHEETIVSLRRQLDEHERRLHHMDGVTSGTSRGSTPDFVRASPVQKLLDQVTRLQTQKSELLHKVAEYEKSLAASSKPIPVIQTTKEPPALTNGHVDGQTSTDSNSHRSGQISINGNGHLDSQRSTETSGQLNAEASTNVISNGHLDGQSSTDRRLASNGELIQVGSCSTDTEKELENANKKSQALEAELQKLQEDNELLRSRLRASIKLAASNLKQSASQAVAAPGTSVSTHLETIRSPTTHYTANTGASISTHLERIRASALHSSATPETSISTHLDSTQSPTLHHTAVTGSDISTHLERIRSQALHSSATPETSISTHFDTTRSPTLHHTATTGSGISNSATPPSEAVSKMVAAQLNQRQSQEMTSSPRTTPINSETDQLVTPTLPAGKVFKPVVLAGHKQTLKTKNRGSQTEESNMFMETPVCDKCQELSLLLPQLAVLKTELAGKTKELEDIKESFATQQEEATRAATQSMHRLTQEKDAELLRLRTALVGVVGTMRSVKQEFSDLKQLYDMLQRQVGEKLRVGGVEQRELRGQVLQFLIELTRSRDEIIGKYQRELKLRQKYHNQLVELRGNIRVLGRIRPWLTDQDGQAGCGGEPVVDTDLDDDGLVHVTSKGRRHYFDLDKVFGADSTQEQIFDEVSSLVRSAVDGYSVCIFAYGQTGAGKTYTMEGPDNDPGINQRALRMLFEEIKSPDWVYSVTASVLEIYNENIRDLLNSDPGHKLEVKMRPEGGLHVPGLTQAPVTSLTEVIEVFETGREHRATESTTMNERSSRSHCLLCVTVRGQNLTTGTATVGRLNLVDLAGSERLSRSQADGQRLKEARNINRSLACLGDVMHALRTKQPHVPYRNSRLTYLLQDSLGGDSKTLMIVQVAPGEKNVGETLCTLTFGQRVRAVELGMATRHMEVTSPSPSTGSSRRPSSVLDTSFSSIESYSPCPSPSPSLSPCPSPSPLPSPSPSPVQFATFNASPSPNFLRQVSSPAPGSGGKRRKLPAPSATPPPTSSTSKPSSTSSSSRPRVSSTTTASHSPSPSSTTTTPRPKSQPGASLTLTSRSTSSPSAFHRSPASSSKPSPSTTTKTTTKSTTNTRQLPTNDRKPVRVIKRSVSSTSEASTSLSLIQPSPSPSPAPSIASSTFSSPPTSPRLPPSADCTPTCSPPTSPSPDTTPNLTPKTSPVAAKRLGKTSGVATQRATSTRPPPTITAAKPPRSGGKPIVRPVARRTTPTKSPGLDRWK